MHASGKLFGKGDLAVSLDHELKKIAKAVAQWHEDEFLATPDSDIAESLEQEFLVTAPVLDRANITTDSVEDGFVTARDFDEDVQIRQTCVTISVPFTGDREVFSLKPDTFTFSRPHADIGGRELKIYWTGPLNEDAAVIRQGLDKQLDDIQKWLGWSTQQIEAYNQRAKQKIIEEVQARKARLLANRNLEAALGFPMHKRPDAATYAVPVTRKKIVPRRPAAAAGPFRPEPALDDAQYEAALEVLRNQRNQLERSPSTTAHLGEEDIRNILLVGLNGQFEGQAAGEVFNCSGKTDILIRSGDRHVFIGECKIWNGPKTITDALDQLLGYLVWRDTKAALLLFIRSGEPTDVTTKAVAKIREHPNYKRDGEHATEERHDFIFGASNDRSREIRLAFLPFVLPKNAPDD